MSPFVVQGDTIYDLPAVATVATELPGGLWEVEVPNGPVAGAYVNKKLTTEQFVAYLSGTLEIPGPNNRPDMEKNVRYFLDADWIADGSGGTRFSDIDPALCCTGTTILVQMYRENIADPIRYDVKLVAIYDATSDIYVNRDGSFFDAPAARVPARFVPIDSPEAQYGYVRRDTNPASISDWRVNQLSIWEINGLDEFATLKQAGGPFPAFTGIEDDYYKPAAAPPGPGGSGTVKFVDGIGPDGNGNVPLAQRNIYGYSLAKRDQVFALFTSATQTKAADVALAGDTSTGIGSRIPDLQNGDMYELVPDPDTPDGDGNATPTWLRY